MHALPLTWAFVTEAWLLENRLRAQMKKKGQSVIYSSQLEKHVNTGACKKTGQIQTTSP